MDFGEVLSTAWKTAWKHKVIYGFGLVGMAVPALMVFLMGGFFAFSTLQELESAFDAGQGGFGIVFFGLLLLLNLVSLVFSALSNAGTYKGTQQALGGAGRLSFSELWEESWPYLGRLAGLFLLIGLGGAVVFAFPALLGMITAGLAFLCILPLMIVFIPLGILMYLILQLGMAAIVCDDLGLAAALRYAWGLIRRKFWPLALMTMILYLVQMMVVTVISLPMFFVQVLVVVPLASGNFDEALIFRGFGIMMAVILPLAFLIQGLSMAYINSAWVVIYLRARPQPDSKPALPIQLESA
jgi:hypothetical protein